MKTKMNRYFTICRAAWVKEFKSANVAVVAEYLGFLSDKGMRPDGKIWKSDREISEGTGLTKSQVRTARKRLEGRFVNKEVHRANGAPTNHYKLTKWGEELVARARAQDDVAGRSQRRDESGNSLTRDNSGHYQETTTEGATRKESVNSSSDVTRKEGFGNLDFSSVRRKFESEGYSWPPRPAESEGL